MNEDAGEGVGVGLPVVKAMAMGCCFSGEGWASALPERRRVERRVERSMVLGSERL